MILYAHCVTFLGHLKVITARELCQYPVKGYLVAVTMRFSNVMLFQMIVP
jgi:hypothetical protein